MSLPSALVPDPFAFTLDALASLGALVEPAPGQAEALLEPALAARLGVPEELTLAPGPPEPGVVGCGLGSPLLERLVADARARLPSARARLAREAPRPAQARSLAERFAPRNGVSEFVDLGVREVLYVALWVAYVAEADDRSEGVVGVIASAPEGRRPDETFAAQLDPLGSALDLVEAPAEATGGAPSDPADEAALAGAGTWLLPRIRAEVSARVADFRAGANRRHARDYERIAGYYEALAAEVKAPRRKADPAAAAAKLLHIAAERDGKLAGLLQRFAVRVSVRPAAALVLSAAAATAQVRVKRRKASRDLTLVLPAGAASLDQLGCEGCHGATAHPALCDAQLHLLCETCAPSAQGRFACPACAAPASFRPFAATAPAGPP
jgi:hypothetical protein